MCSSIFVVSHADTQQAARMQYFVHCTRVIFVCCTPVVKLRASHSSHVLHASHDCRVNPLIYRVAIHTLYTRVINYEMVKSMDTQKSTLLKIHVATFTPVHSGRHYIASLQYQIGSQTGDLRSTITNKSVTCM